MDFSISEQQRLILESVDRFVDHHLPAEEIRRRDAEHDPPYHLLPLMGEIGLLGLPFSTAYGGLGETWETVALVQERMGQRAAMAVSLFNRAVAFGGMSLLTYGTAAQREALIPRIVRGELLFALALSEPGAGSDAAALITRARRSTDGWLINGRKSWISDANAADYLVTACRTGAPDSGARGISVLLVPRGTKGLHLSPLPKVGNNCLPSYDVAFEDVLVPHDALMGAEHEGFKHIMATLHYSRASMAAHVTGQAQAVVNMVLQHARSREQFGRPIGRFQTIQHRLADMQTAVDQSRLLMYYLAWLIRENRPCRKESAQAKIVATETLRDVTDAGMQIMASAGYSSEGDLQRYWRDSRLYTFGEGSNEIQRNIIARELDL